MRRITTGMSSSETSSGISRVALDTGVPVANAVLTVREFSTLADRSLPGHANKGYEAAQAAITTANVLRALTPR